AGTESWTHQESIDLNDGSKTPSRIEALDFSDSSSSEGSFDENDEIIEHEFVS
ncbi:hypothetical protein AVEN_87739-1, partial [Araneus ventricosus]